MVEGLFAEFLERRPAGVPCQALTNSIEAAGPGVLWCLSARIADRRYAKRENALRVVLLELRDSDGAPAKQLLDDAKRKVTLLDINHLGWNPRHWLIAMKSASLVMTGIPPHFRPVPDALVIRLP